MPSLLSLPRELRDEIIDHVIVDVPTIDPLATIERKGFRLPMLEKNYSRMSPDIMFPIDPVAYRSNTYGLLLTNIQLHHETKSRLRTIPINYTLNIAVFPKFLMCPTWTYIPTQSRRINTFDINLQISHLVPHLDLVSLAFISRHLLDFVLRLGPTVPFSIKTPTFDYDQFISVKELRLNFRPLEVPNASSIQSSPQNTDLSATEVLSQTTETGVDILPFISDRNEPRPNYQDLARVIDHKIQTQIRPPYRTGPFTCLLVQRVGEMKLRIGNLEPRTYDMAAYLRQPDEPKHHLWKEGVIAERIKFGLPVPLEAN